MPGSTTPPAKRTHYVPYAAPDPSRLYPIQVYQTITCQAEYRNFEFEELRLSDYLLEAVPTPEATEYWQRLSAGTMHADEFLGHSLRTFGDMMTGDVYDVKVGRGASRKTFHVHGAVLQKCPPFAAAIAPGAFRNSHTKELDLDDDDPDVFEILLEYLYTGEFVPKITQFQGTRALAVVVPNGIDTPFVLARLYCLVDKYFVDAAKAVILEKLTLCNMSNLTFLEIANFAYESLPENEHCLFRHWVRRYISANKASLLHRQEVKTIVEKGGPLAWELFSTFTIMRV